MIADKVLPTTDNDKGRVRYEFARTSNGPIHIRDFGRSTNEAAWCFGCERPLIAKATKSEKVRAHFAHAVAVEPSCNPETALHRTGKALVRAGFLAARREGRPYLLDWRCSHCSSNRRVDMTARWTDMVEEAAPTPGVRSDLLAIGQRPFAIEVVVTHDLEATTVARYARADVPVFVIRPSWETVAELQKGIRADEALGLAKERCPGCRGIESFSAALHAETRRPDPEVQRILGAWPPARDRFGRTLSARVREEARAQAARLVTIGFIPLPKNPWLFWRRLPDGAGRVLVHVGGTEFCPLRESTAASVEMHISRPERQRMKFEEVVAALVRGAGVEIEDSWE